MYTNKSILWKIPILFCLNLFSMNFIFSEKPETEITELLKNGIPINKVLDAKRPCSFEYSAIFGAIISNDLDDETLQKNLLNYVKVGLWLYKNDESLQYDIGNIITYIKNLPEQYKEYDFKSFISKNEISDIEDSFSEISESHTSTVSSDSSEGINSESSSSLSKNK